MRIGYFADGEWSRLALEKILNNSQFEVAFIVGRYPKPDSALNNIALHYEIPFIVHENVNSKDFLEKIKKYNVDINISMSFDQIFRSQLINLAPKGLINCHAGALPFYRGRNILNWVLINGEKQFGVTVHYIDENVDTGDIICQEMVDILDSDDYGSILKKAVKICAEILYKALCQIKEDRVVRIKQNSIHPIGSYFTKRKEGDEAIDWSLSSKRVFNFIRGITSPGPGARTYLNGQEYIIWKSSMVDNAVNYCGIDGEVVGKNKKGNYVKTGDNVLLIETISSHQNEGALNSKTVPQFKIGTRFESKIQHEMRKINDVLNIQNKDNSLFKGDMT